MEITVNIELTKAEFCLFELIGGDTPYNRNKFLSAMLHQALAKRIKWVNTFNARIDKAGPIPANHTTPCWTWTGGKIPSGYGIAHDPITNKITSAHRLMYELSRGPIPKGMIIMHSCDNRSCVNPDHHSVGTHKENTADMYAKGRQYQQSRVKGNRRAKLTRDQVAQIKMLRESKKISYAELSDLFGVTVSSVGNIFRGRTWRS